MAFFLVTPVTRTASRICLSPDSLVSSDKSMNWQALIVFQIVPEVDCSQNSEGMNLYK